MEFYPCVDLTPWGVGDDSQLFTVERARLTWGRPAEYSDLSVVARQAVALVTFRRWRQRVGMEHLGVDSLEHHLWSFMTVTPATFAAWYGADPLTRLRSSDPLPAAICLAAESCRVDLSGLRRALASLIAITYGGLFGALESSWSLDDLKTVGEFTSRDDVPLVAPADFVASLWVDDDWGHPSGSIVDHWRSRA
jgi:hypothetical protein